MSNKANLDDECFSCVEETEEQPEDQCPQSKRPCGHHCNHAWTDEECCWCGKVFGDPEVIEQTRDEAAR